MLAGQDGANVGICGVGSGNETRPAAGYLEHLSLPVCARDWYTRSQSWDQQINS